MKDHVLQTIKKYEMFEPNDVVVLAVSGGIDSMVLLRLVVEFRTHWNLTIVVAHLDHGKREVSYLDRLLIEKVTQENGVVFECEAMPNQEASGNFHDYARKKRYEFFARIARKYRAHKVVTAHHGDDHLETVVARLLKNSTPASLIGIRAKGKVNGLKVVRPLIDVRKEDIYLFAKAHGLAYNEDVTNETDLYLRNRIRHHITPKLLKEDQGILKQVRQLSDHLEVDEDYFSKQVDDLMEKAIKTKNGQQLSRKYLKQWHPSVLRRWIKRLVPSIDQNTILSTMALLNSDKSHWQLDVGEGKVMKASYDDVYCVSKQVESPSSYDFELKIGEEVLLPCGGKLSVSPWLHEKKIKNDPNVLYLCYNSGRLPLRVRSRQPGDRIKLMNQLGSSKVKKMMIDAKIPRDQRALWPIVVDKDDEVIWIPELRKAPLCLDENEKNTRLTIEYTRERS